MDQPGLQALRHAIRAHWVADEADLVAELAAKTGLGGDQRAAITEDAAQLVRLVRAETEPSLMESFLAEYGLSTEEGVGLMCLAEALLRVPDAETVDELISDKIEPGNWEVHRGHSSSSMVNAATWALMLTGKVLDDDATWPTTALRGLIRRVGEPVVRTAVGRAMRLMGEQFVLGETMDAALQNARRYEAMGYTYSYDMLGEAARTDADAERYRQAYERAIEKAGAKALSDVRSSPGVSIKLSALSPRYEGAQRARVMARLVPVVTDLARLAAGHGIGLNIDAEEANRLDVSLDVIEAVVADPSLAGWDGFGIVVQAYGRRALPVIDWIAALAEAHDRRLMVRLVKGAYWDTEIKSAQVLGLPGFPVFTEKSHTDVSYLACAHRLLTARQRIYGQFATHNAHTVAAIRAMADDPGDYEFQRLHGMGEALHEIVRDRYGTRCRIYAPVGAHEDLLAYLVRRLLENGANSSFVNQIVDEDIPAAVIAHDPVELALQEGAPRPHANIKNPDTLFQPERANSQGYDINEPASISDLIDQRDPWRTHRWTAPHNAEGPAFGATAGGAAAASRTVYNPAAPDDCVGMVFDASPEMAQQAVTAGLGAFPAWQDRGAKARAAILRDVAAHYEANTAELCALCAREAGKTLSDAIAEIREAVDFLYYYAGEAERLETAGAHQARGVFVCISPWNFPLAIFTGQIAAALAAGNAVVAKPAEQSPLIAARAVAFMHDAGVPRDIVQLIPGDGATVGAALAGDPRIAGVCFTGSTQVARQINRSLVANAGPEAVLIAETGGLNAMIVDSTALPEQAVRDIVVSAFQSAGQRCSALRILYIQEDVAERLMTMLMGAMETLVLGNPWLLSTDIGPVIDENAQSELSAYCEAAENEGRLVKRVDGPDTGTFFGPTIVKVGGIADLPREIFGPVLHVATFKADEIDTVISHINARGYGLTFALHTRIDDRVDQVVGRINVGNAYINRNQIGAIVGSQPFGGEGLSGTGPKAGGPHYVARFYAAPETVGDACNTGKSEPAASNNDPRADWDRRCDRRAVIAQHLAHTLDTDVRAAVKAGDDLLRTTVDLPGPTGETNRLQYAPRGMVLCLGPTHEALRAQAAIALAAGNRVMIDADLTALGLDALRAAGAPIEQLSQDAAAFVDQRGDLAAICAKGDHPDLSRIAITAAERDGAIVPIIVGDYPPPDRLVLERHLCVDTTAAGGNAALLVAAAQSEAAQSETAKSHAT